MILVYPSWDLIIIESTALICPQLDFYGVAKMQKKLKQENITIAWPLIHL